MHPLRGNQTDLRSNNNQSANPDGWALSAGNGSDMAWTQTELDALKRAFASGTLRVSADGRTVEYGNADDLLRRIRAIKNEVASVAGRPLPIAGLAGFRRI